MHPPAPDTSFDSWLATLPADRRVAIDALLAVIRAHLPVGYEESFSGGFVCWQVPLAVYPDTYNGKPLMYAALASQKSHMAVYLCNVYGLPELRARFEAGWRAAGKRLDMGQACVRFKKLDDVALPVIGDTIAATPMEPYVAHVKAVHANTKTGARKAAASRRKSGAEG
jgi:hypothetical protein